MIKVIKHGQKEFTHTCSRCGCEFTYEDEDIRAEATLGAGLRHSSPCYVICPDCGKKCYINDDNIGWPWPNIGEPIPCNTPSDTVTALHPCSNCNWWKKMKQPGFTYIGDTPCTWCQKSPSKVTCDTIPSTLGYTALTHAEGTTSQSSSEIIVEADSDNTTTDVPPVYFWHNQCK